MKPSLPRAILCAVLWFALAMAPALAAGPSFELTVAAGGHDRANTPVVVLLPAAADANSVALTDADGNRLDAQLTAPGLLRDSAAGQRELHFILPSLKKGRTLKLTAAIGGGGGDPGGETFAWQRVPGEYCELSLGDRPVVRYICKTLTEENREEAYKVFHHLYDPAGTRLVTKGSGGLYPHHRGLFFGYCNVGYGNGRKADTWSGHNTPQTHGGVLAEEAGPVLGRHLLDVQWRGKDREVYLHEKRELCVYNTPGGRLIEFASRLVSAGGPIKLDGNAPHAGFHFRADQEVAAGTEKLTYYVRPDGKGEMGRARASAMDLPWDAISFVLGETRYTLAYLDRPTNPKPVEYNERTYGRFGSFFKYELDDGKDLQVDYRVWLQDGEMTVEQVAALSADFVDPVQVTFR
ncbi:MAG: PmoA family protein [Pirellulales bacterium]|nr:PmoA family protein [Pirellulales bacterium]